MGATELVFELLSLKAKIRSDVFTNKRAFFDTSKGNDLYKKDWGELLKIGSDDPSKYKSWERC